MTRGLLCLVLVACASQAAPKAPQPANVADILRATAETYAHAKSYLDHGRIHSVVHAGAVVEVNQTLTIAFVRPDQFRMELRQDDNPATALVIWRYEGFASLASPVETTPVEPAVAVAEASARVGGDDLAVPALLMPGTTQLERLTDARIDGDEPIAGHTCWRITAQRALGTSTFWIDKVQHVIRRARHHVRGRDGTGELEATIDYEPSIDAAVEASMLQAPPPHSRPPAPAWLGVMFDGHNGTTRIQSVVSGGPAEHAGLEAGDVITKIDAAPVSKAADVVARIRAEKPGTRLHVTVERGGKEMPVEVALEKRPELDDLQGRLVGKPAPDFALAPLTAGSAKLADLKGHVVIVDFWATWCGPCGIAMPHLVELGHKYKDLRIVGISDEDEADIKKYVADHSIDYTIARDADDVVTGHYLVTGLPTLVIIDKAGVVRALHVGAGDFDAIEAEVQRYLR